MRQIKVISACLSLLLWVGPPLYASNSDDIRNYGRLRQLQQATGVTPAANSFETRLNTMLNPGSQLTPAFDSQARKDYAITQEFQSKAKLDALQDQKNTARSRKAELGYLPKNDTGLAGTNLAEELKVPNSRDQFKDQTSYVDATEEKYQETIEKKMRDKEEAEDKEETALQTQSKEPNKEKSSLAPSLDNNPFYFSKNAANQSDADNFEVNKPLILTRMVQSGLFVDEAEQILATSSSSEDAMLILMQDHGKTYSEAKDMTRSKKS